MLRPTLTMVETYVVGTDDEPLEIRRGHLNKLTKRIAELEGALRHATKFEDALREIAHGNWSNVKPDSQAASDLSQIVAEMQRIASEAIR